MAQAASNYLESGVLTSAYCGETFPVIGTVYVALCQNIPTDNALNEVPNSAGYARQGLTANHSNWHYREVAGGSGVIYNGAVIEFPQCTADLGYVSGAATVTSATYGAGNMLHRGSIGAARVLQQNDQIRIPVSGLVILMS